MILPNRGQRLICIVAPCFNEEDVIEQFYEHLVRVLRGLDNVEYRIHFIDDGSSDATLNKLHEIALQDERVFVFSLSRNFGKEVAIAAGLDTAVGKAVILLDTDLQHPPELIPQMLELWRQGNDIVTAVRNSNADSGFFKRVTSRLFYALLSRFSETPIVPNATDFCVLSERARKALQAMPERHRFLRGLISWIGFRRGFVEFEAPPRAGGQTKYTPRRLWALASSAFFSFSTVPIKIAIRLGLLLVVGSASYLLFVLVRFLSVGIITAGWSSLICSMLILGGTQLIFMGLIGEYLARVYEEAKQRPLYFFKDEPGPREFDSPSELTLSDSRSS